MAVLITKRLSQKLYASAWRAICSTPDKPYWLSKFPDGKPRSFDEMPVMEEKNYDLRKYHELSMQWFQKYGYVVKEWHTKDYCSIHLYHFDDFRTVYNNDGMYPVRRSHTAVRRYREERKHQYDNVGLGPGMGEEWWQLRGMMPAGLTDRLVRPLHSTLEEVADDLVKMLRLKSEEGEVDALPWLFRWAFESAAVVTLNRRMNALSEDGGEEADKMVEAAGVMNEAISLTEVYSPDYEHQYHRLSASQDYMYSVVNEYVEQIDAEEDSNCVVKMLLTKGKGSKKNALTLTMDMFQGALQTVPLTVLMALYNLARNKDVQDTARKEVMKVLPCADSRFFETVKKGKDDLPRYLDAVVWETLRVNPPIIGNGRVLQEDLVLGGYQVPKGINTVLHHQVAGMLEENFEEAGKFKPERHPTIYMPCLEYIFGAKRRTCLGKNFSLVQMCLVIAKILRDFEVSCEGGEIAMINRLHNEPEKPLYLRFEPLV